MGTADPFAAFPVYRSADHREPEVSAPLYVHASAELRQQCRIALDRRRAIYPAWIKDRKITAGLAERDIRAWEQLLAMWTWIVDGPDAPGAALPPRETLFDRIEAVDLALVRVDQEMGRGNRSYEILLQSHLNQALRWHLERERFDSEAPAARAARLTRELRDQRAESKAA